MKRSIVNTAAAVLLLTASRVHAQVGYLPTRSPYLDLEQSQEFSLIVGPYHGHRDPADVAPQGGLLVGGQYQWRAGGPAYLVGEIDRVESDDRIVNPFKNGAARDEGTRSRPLWAADFDLGIGLTGGKSWHHFVPEVGGGLGLISQFGAPADTGGFKFGTRFTLNMFAGLAYVRHNWAIRADIRDHLYTIQYPESFYVAPTGGTAVLTDAQAKSIWTNNPALTFGISRLF